jgi:hypothetical protein
VAESKLYPEPPHLTIAVYPEGPENECFAAACRVVAGLGGRPTGVLELAPAGVAFEMRADLAGRSSVVEVGRTEFEQMVAGRDPAVRPVRAGYLARPGGIAVVEYLSAWRASRHPIAVSTAAGALGVPVDGWGRGERGAAARSVRWALQVLQGMTTNCAAVYGAIGVECDLATPGELASGAATLPSEIFLSRRAAAGMPGLWESFADNFRDGEIVEWPTGWFFSGWAPFNSRNVTLSPSRTRPRRAGMLLGRAVQG